MEKEIRWSAPEFHYYHKDVGWYWLVIIVAIILTALALWQKNFLFAIFIILAGILTISWGRKEPKTVDFVLSEKGLDIGDKKSYPFENLAGFAIIAVPGESEISELVLETKGRFNKWVKVIIADERSEAIKKILLSRIPEVPYEESFAEHIARILRF